MRDRFPGLPETSALGPDSPAKRAVQLALAEIYHPAQLDVLRRISAMRLSS